VTEKVSPIDEILAKMRENWPDNDVDAVVTIKRLYHAREVFFGSAKLVMEKFSLSAGEYDALGSLRIQGEPFELTPSDICQANMLSSGGLTKVLNHLESRGLITRRACIEDQRSRKVQLTSQGKQLIDSMLQEVFVSYRNLMNIALTVEEQKTLDELLQKIDHSLI
jgi:DNA-binding MarR family transcriptional regulator